MPLNIQAANVKYANPSGLGTNPFTMECWFYADDIVTQQYLMHLNTTADGAVFYSLLQIATSSRLNLIIGGNFGGPTSAVSLRAKTWYHVVASCSNEAAAPAIMNLWTNGVLEDLHLSTTITPATNAGSIDIGGRTWDTNRRPVSVKMHKVRIYNTASISDTDVIKAYRNPKDYDLATTYAANLVFRADYDSTTDATCLNGTKTATVNGTSAVLTNRYPLDLPGVAFLGDFSSNSNTITSNKITTLVDLSGNGNDLINGSGTGPAFVNTGSGIAVAHGAFVEFSPAFLARASTTGSPFDSRNVSIVAWMSSDKCGYATRQSVIELGDPSVTNHVAFGLSIGPTGYLQSTSSGSNFRTANLLSPSNPRMNACVSYNYTDTSGVELYVSKFRTFTSGSLPSVVSIGGLIIGNQANWSTPFQGDLYYTAIYQRALSSGEISALDDWGKTYWKYGEPTYILSCEGSSTMDGTASVSNQNLVQKLGNTVTGFLVYNFANGAENRAHFLNQYTKQLGCSGALYGIPKSNRFCLLQPYGNDFDYGATPSATINSDYSTLFNLILADYNKCLVMYPQPRTTYGSSSSGSALRESDLVSFMAYCSNFSSNNTVINRPSLFQPASSSYVDQLVVTQGGLYAGDETHLSNSGYQYEADAIAPYITSLISPSILADLIWRGGKLAFLRGLNVLHILGS